MYKIVVGEISKRRQEQWFCTDDNPYAVWEGKPLAEVICTGGVWAAADEMLRQHVDIDWGSIAWKGNKEELRRFFRACKLEVSKLKPLREKVDYAVVFIETVFGDSA